MVPSVSVIVPVFNEEDTVVAVLADIRPCRGLLEIIVVDDGSTDETFPRLEEWCAGRVEIQLLRIATNEGKTSAVRAGTARTRGEVVVIQDADGEYDSASIPSLIGPILRGEADAVYGSRYLSRGPNDVGAGQYYLQRLANRILTALANLFLKEKLSDVETGMKAFRGDVIREMILTSTRFGFEIEVTAKLAKLGCSIREVPVPYHGRTYEQGKKIRWKDALAAIWFVLKYNLFCSLDASYRSLPEFARPKARPRIEVR